MQDNLKTSMTANENLFNVVPQPPMQNSWMTPSGMHLLFISRIVILFFEIFIYIIIYSRFYDVSPNGKPSSTKYVNLTKSNNIS